MLKLACCIFATALLLVSCPVKSKTAIITVTFCDKPLYVFAVTDIDGVNEAHFGSYKAIKENEKSLSLLNRMLEDTDLTFKKWRLEDEAGLTCT